MGASATQDEDIIIFNDESEFEELEIVNGQEPKKIAKEEKVVESKAVETDELISFSNDEAKEDKEGIVAEESSVEENLIDLVSEETTQESPSIEEQLKNLEVTNDEIIEETVVEGAEKIVIKDSNDETTNTDESEGISLEVEEDTTEDPSSDDFKNQLIEAQDKADGVSFEDMGIDLSKLWDSEGENLKNIEIETEATAENSLEAETAVFWGVALLWLEGQKNETTEIESNELKNDLWGFGDLTEGLEEIDEGTHDGILEAAILKLVNRDKAIDEEIAKEEEDKAQKKDAIAELKRQIKALQWAVNAIDSDIKELNVEKATTIKTKEGLEKMKIAA